jgi:hypothetical protein
LTCFLHIDRLIDWNSSLIQLLFSLHPLNFNQVKIKCLRTIELGCPATLSTLLFSLEHCTPCFSLQMEVHISIPIKYGNSYECSFWTWFYRFFIALYPFRGERSSKRKELHGTINVQGLSGHWVHETETVTLYWLDFLCDQEDENYVGFVLLMESVLDDDVAFSEIDLFLVLNICFTLL